MAKDPSEDMSTPQLVAQSGFLGRHVLLAGVVGACALGVGAGLWARPAPDERRMTPVQARPAATPKPAGRLEIVVDDSPAPIGAPIEVLPALDGQAPAGPLLAAPQPPATEATPLAPVRPPAGLVRVQAVEPIELEPEPLPPPKPIVKAAPKPEKKAEKKPVAAKKPARSEPAAKPKTPAADRKVAKAEPDSKKPQKRAQKPAKVRDAKLAKAETTKPAKATEARTSGKLGKALAKVTPKKVQDAAKTSKTKLAESRKARAEKARLERAKVEKAKVEKARVEKARLEKARLEKTRLEKARVQKAKAAKARSERAKVVKAATPKPAPPVARPAAPKPTRDNPIRKASNRCASADPGEAIVCADPSLGAADRQLARAYRQAEAAGVSAGQLARQQQRWLAARAQAAREAPWAVRDVYEARIAELNDMTRGARSEY